MPTDITKKIHFWEFLKVAHDFADEADAWFGNP